MKRFLLLGSLGLLLAGCLADKPDFTGAVVIPPGGEASVLIEAPEDDQVRWSYEVTGNATCATFFDGSPAPDFRCHVGNFQGHEMLFELRWRNDGSATALVKYKVWTEGTVYS